MTSGLHKMQNDRRRCQAELEGTRPAMPAGPIARPFFRLGVPDHRELADLQIMITANAQIANATYSIIICLFSCGHSAGRNLCQDSR
jgi:hypothetical protein